MEKSLEHHSSTLAWKIPWTEEPGRLQSEMTERLHFHFSLSCIGEGYGNPLQCSCLENPRDRGAWWAAVSGCTESDTTEETAAAAVKNRENVQKETVIEVPFYSYSLLKLFILTQNAYYTFKTQRTMKEIYFSFLNYFLVFKEQLPLQNALASFCHFTHQRSGQFFDQFGR